MTLRSLIKVSEKFIIDNSPTILSGIALTGTLTVAYLTGKATFKASKIIAEEEHERSLQELREDDPVTKKEAFKLVWTCYIPPAIAIVGTGACIVLSNHINARRMAALAAAYKLSEKQWEEYKDKVLEKLGVKEEKRMRDEINEEQFRKNPPSDDIQVLATEDEQLFLESWTGRYFRSKMHYVKAAENRINANLIHDRYSTLSDFYDEIGLARTSASSEVGWSIENPICLDFTTTLADGGTKPCIVMEYSNLPSPIRHYIAGRHGSDDYLGVH